MDLLQLRNVTCFLIIIYRLRGSIYKFSYIFFFSKFRDFLLVYNQISETCFKRCTDTFLTREITSNEVQLTVVYLKNLIIL